jgi:nucleoside diphosphate kinase
MREGVLSAADMRLVRPPASQADESQALLFLKPEALTREVAIADLAALVLNHLRETDLSLGGVSILGWKLMASGMIAEHYSVINRVSRYGERAITSSARAAIQPLTEDGKLEILGGHELIQRSGLSAHQLQALATAAGTEKVAQGTYVTSLEQPFPVIVLNAFHPEQLEHFTAPGAVVVALEVGFSYPWQEFRDHVLGATDPLQAQPNSLRRKLLEARAELKLPEVSRNRNCVHGSGGPIEAMTEVARFFRIPLTETKFGTQMLEAGLDGDTLSWAASNPLLDDGSSLFEVTECTDPWEALNILQSLRLPSESRR